MPQDNTYCFVAEVTFKFCNIVGFFLTITIFLIQSRVIVISHKLFPNPLVPTCLLDIYLSLFQRQNFLLSNATSLHYEKLCNHCNILQRFYFIQPNPLQQLTIYTMNNITKSPQPLTKEYPPNRTLVMRQW